MANPVRQLVNRWRFGALLPEKWEDARRTLNQKLKELERVINVLHGAIEYTSIQTPTRTAASGNTTINSTTYADITGASSTYTPDFDGTLWLQVTFYVTCATFGAIGDLFNGTVAVNGSASGIGISTGFSAAGDTRVINRVFQTSVTSGASYTLKLQAKQGAGTSTYTVLPTLTQFEFLTVPNLYKVP